MVLQVCVQKDACCQQTVHKVIHWFTWKPMCCEIYTSSDTFVWLWAACDVYHNFVRLLHITELSQQLYEWVLCVSCVCGRAWAPLLIISSAHAPDTADFDMNTRLSAERRSVEGWTHINETWSKFYHASGLSTTMHPRIVMISTQLFPACQDQLFLVHV